MEKQNKPEVWLRGPLAGYIATLQPVAHALLQAVEEVRVLMEEYPNNQLWDRPAGVASVAFHLQHLVGVLDRLFTYARGEALTNEQLQALAAEGKEQPGITSLALVERFEEQVQKALVQLRETDEALLTQERTVGRGKLPSTVLGLYVHAAEHTMRHVGQLLVTVKFTAKSVQV